MRGMLWTINSSVSIFERYTNSSKKSQEAMSPAFSCFLLILGEPRSNKINKLIRIRTQLLPALRCILYWLTCNAKETTDCKDRQRNIRVKRERQIYCQSVDRNWLQYFHNSVLPPFNTVFHHPELIQVSVHSGSRSCQMPSRRDIIVVNLVSSNVLYVAEINP